MLLDKIPTPWTFNAFKTTKQTKPKAVQLFLLIEIVLFLLPVFYWFILMLFVCMHPDKEINVLKVRKVVIEGMACQLTS